VTIATAPATAPRPPGSEDTAIRTEDLRKTYKSGRGDVEAVRGIDLDIPQGEFFGLLGPNGAGKSTTIGMLTTLVMPTSGRAWVAGHDVTKDPVAVKRRIGVVTQNNTLDMELTVTENLEFRSRFFGLPKRTASSRAGQLIEAFGLGDRRNAMADQLSGGQARRLLIARALVHQPDVLFLDEPTAGLDPQTRVNLWDILRVLHGQGQTVLLTTHYMEEAEALCDRIAIVDHGKVLAEGTVDELKNDADAVTVVTVRFEQPVPAGFAQRAGLLDRPDVTKAEAEGDQLRVFSSEPEGLLGDLVTLAAADGLHVRDASTLNPSLETVFLTLTGREYRE
jgi:daunorubicin resistance ABC transporter ATP-binding subunit